MGNPKIRDHLKDPHVDGIIILNLIFKKLGGMVWTEFVWLGIRTTGGIL